MNVKLFLLLLCVVPVLHAQAQKFVTEKTSVGFYSHAAIEDIKAENLKASGLFDPATSDIAFVVPIGEFKFEKSLMQEHFNEKYMETERYPKATFQGKVTGFDASAGVSQPVVAKGKLTIHGVTQTVEIPGELEKRGDALLLKAKFVVKLVDYKIDIPKLLWQNVAEQVEVTVQFSFKPQTL
ncbi:YceI family protein [Chryseolinea lacunae]|uniref:YceI family protein n=1 Tax=Chryseolinea lacunae TaxID=2801331 RepID=A0ABS1KMA3_9BACT|nr:YceI family protein [Chryseolinea lacunae]MBL0740464.1 YceI family protein [Chryseolinea lacunae]